MNSLKKKVTNQIKYPNYHKNNEPPRPKDSGLLQALIFERSEN